MAALPNHTHDDYVTIDTLNSFEKIYTFNTHNTYKKLGTINLPQSGNSIKIQLITGSGHNGAASQEIYQTIILRSSNGNANSKGEYAAGYNYVYSDNNYYNIYIKQLSSTKFEIWTSLINYSGDSMIKVSCSRYVSFEYSSTTSSTVPDYTFVLPVKILSYNGHTHDYLPLTGGTMTGDITLPDNKSIIQHQKSDSNYTVAVKWLQGGVSEAYSDPHIGHHNMGDTNGGGAIVLLPYSTNNEVWRGNDGLYVGSSNLKFNGTKVSLEGHTHSYLPISNPTVEGTLTTARINNTLGNVLISQSSGNSTYIGNSSVKTVLFADAGLLADIGGSRYTIYHSGNLTPSNYATTAQLANYLPLSGGIVNGNLRVDGTSSFYAKSGGGTYFDGDSEGGGRVIMVMDTANPLGSGMDYLAIEKYLSGHANISNENGVLALQTNSYNVAIGGTTADEKLHVHGNVKATKFIGDVSGNATGIAGWTINDSGNTPFGSIVTVNGLGWSEMGRHIEFHCDNTTGSDYSTILRATGNYGNVVSLPSSSGTLALTSDLSDYLSLTNGGQIKSNFSLLEGKNILLRPSGYDWYSGIGHDTAGNECIALWAKNSVTGLRFHAGIDLSGGVTSGSLMGIDPDFEICKASGEAKGWIGGSQILTAANYPAWCASTGHTHNFADLSNHMVATNEFNFIPNGYNSDVYFNYRAIGGNGQVNAYRFTNGAGTGGYTNVYARAFYKSDGTEVSYDGHTHSYLPLSGGNMVSGARISASGGPLYLGNSDSANWVHMADMCSQSGSIYWNIYTNGLAKFASTVTASNFITDSDKRLKTNINEISSDKLSNSLNLNFVEFDYKDNDNHSAGHIAQEVKEVLPEFVHGNESETEHLSIDYTGLHSVQIKALIDENNIMKKEIKELKELIKTLINEK